MRGTPYFLLTFTAGIVVAVSGTANAGSHRLADGVLVDPTGSVVYIMSAGGITPSVPTMSNGTNKLIAVEAETGNIRWETAVAAKPMGIVSDRLIAIGADNPHLGIVALDTRSGHVAAVCPDPAPSGTLGIVDGLGTHYSSSGRVNGGRVLITWSAVTHYSGGAAPTPGQAEAARSRSMGEISVDPISGCGKTVPQSLGPSGVRFPHLPGLLSLDHRHGLVSRQVKVGGITRYNWTIEDAVTHKKFETRGRGFQPSSFVVLRRTLLATQGTLVEAVSTTGESRWIQAVRPTGYVGPYPP